MAELGAPNRRAETLRSAEKLINGDRAQTYGPPEISFGRIAALWNAMGAVMSYRDLSHADGGRDPGLSFRDLTAHDAALMMALMKVSRAVGRPEELGFGPDDYDDMAGYVALAAELAEQERRRLPRSKPPATAQDVADWFRSGHGTGVEGNERIAARIEEVFGGR